MGIGFAGGLASGLQAGFETAGRQRERRLQELQFSAEQRREILARLEDGVQSIVGQIGDIRAVGGEPGPALTALMEDTISTADRFNLAGRTRNRFNAAMEKPGPVQEGVAAGAQEVAQATQTLGRPLEENEREALVFGQATNPRSDLIDETGAVRNEVVSEIRRQVSSLFASGQDVFGRPIVSGENAAAAQEVITEAARILRKGQGAVGIAEAVSQALQERDFQPQPAPQFDIPVEERRRISAMNAEITKATITMQRMFEQIPLATGAASKLKAFADATVGQLAAAFGADEPLFADTQDARAAVRRFVQQFQRAFVNNPRFPVAEQQRLAQLLPEPDAFFRNPQTALRNFKTMFDELRVLQFENEQLLAGQPIGIPQFNSPDDPGWDRLPTGAPFIDHEGGLRFKG